MLAHTRPSVWPGQSGPMPCCIRHCHQRLLHTTQPKHSPARVAAINRFCPPNPCSAGSSPRQAGTASAAAVETASVQAPETAASTAAVPAEYTKAYMQLQNGSDVRGVAIDALGQSVTLSPSIAFFIARGFAEWLSIALGRPMSSLTVSIGRDPRLSGPLLAASMAAGLATKGCSVARFGPATTPAMFMSTILPGYEYDGAIIITASHLPFNRNGMKFFTGEGGLEKRDITSLLTTAGAEAAAAEVYPGDDHMGTAYVMAMALSVHSALVRQVDFMPVYCQHLRSIIIREVDRKDNRDKPLEGFHIVVDAGNGGGGFFATDVLAPLGADITGSQFLDPDGRFPNHIPNPEDATAMASACQMVLQSGADLGVIFDTDVDRSGVVASNGEPINSNRYIALMASITLRSYPGTTIVTDSVTSNGLTDFITAAGGRHFRYRRGYKNVIGKGVELNRQGTNCELMMETSGHGAMKENYFLDDGTYSATKIVVEMVKRAAEGAGKDIGAELLKNLKEPLESQEYRLKALGEDWKADCATVLERFHGWVTSGAQCTPTVSVQCLAGAGPADWSLEEENYEGWRVVVDEGEGRRGWALLRSSLHDPLLVLNVESDQAGGAADIKNKVLDFFAHEATDIGIDLSPLLSQQ